MNDRFKLTPDQRSNLRDQCPEATVFHTAVEPGSDFVFRPVGLAQFDAFDTRPAALNAIDEQVRLLCASALSATEIERAIKQASALFAYGSDNITNQGFWMGYASSFADYQWVAEYLPACALSLPTRF